MSAVRGVTATIQVTMPKAKLKPSLAQVKAWLATVVAPMVTALEQELVQLKARDWSFRFYSEDFEYLWPTDRMVALPYHPNLRQFWRYHPKLQVLAEAHDSSLDDLRTKCRTAFRSLMGEKAFITFAETVSPDDTSAARYFAEYVINGLQDLGARNVLRDRWSANRDAFLSLRNANTVAPQEAELQRVGSKFARAAGELFSQLDHQQQVLADEHGLPPIAPSDLAAS